MGKKGLLLCVCQGTCPSFQDMNIFEVGNAIRREKLVDYAAIHPQLCAEDGDEFLSSLLSGDSTDRLYVAGCAPNMMRKMYRDAFDAAGFNVDNFRGVEIRGMNTEQAISAIKDLIVQDGA